jgi:hypothetical protein
LPSQNEIPLNVPFIADNEIDIYGIFRYACRRIPRCFPGSINASAIRDRCDFFTGILFPDIDAIVGLPSQNEIPLNVPFIADNEIDIYGIFRYANTSFPPRRTEASADCNAAGFPAVSQAASTPLPFVIVVGPCGADGRCGSESIRGRHNHCDRLGAAAVRCREKNGSDSCHQKLRSRGRMNADRKRFDQSRLFIG